jgi:hypothetical protein
MPKIHGTHYKLAQQMVIRNITLFALLFVVVVAIAIVLFLMMGIDWCCKQAGWGEPFKVCYHIDQLSNSDNMDGYEL